MPRTLFVHFLPSLTSAEQLAGAVVVIDVLRASTTITAALAAGAQEVIPCLEVSEAQSKGAELGSQPKPLLGGERNGVRIEGFDLGNSPSEFTSQAVRDRIIVFTTTNGTRALRVCSAAREALIGSFVNLSAVARRLTGSDLSIHLLCAGTNGQITREDVLFAGALVEQLAGKAFAENGLNDQGRIARDAWRQAMGSLRPPDPAANQRLSQTLRDTQGGRNLLALGLERDIDDAAQIDRYDFVPVLDAGRWRITRPNS